MGWMGKVRFRFLKEQKGFTLLEVLVAVGILGLIGVAFLTALNTNSRAARTLDEQVVATNLATVHLEVITPGVETDIEYTITITNLDGSTHIIQEITDYLPLGFNYLGPTSGLTNLGPKEPIELENINGVDRWHLLWTQSEFPGGGAKSIASGETLALTFWARATKDVSGSYYNEVLVIPSVPVPTIFSEIGVSAEEYYACYSWNTGAVIVPAYDVQADADGATVDANMSLTLEGVSITSYQVK